MEGQSGNPGNGLLEEIRRRRAELIDSMHEVEHALAAPAVAGAEEWAARLRGALEELVEDFDEHIAITEGPSGLYHELETQAQRLSGPVERLTREHVEIARQLQDLVAAVADAAAADVERVRVLGIELFGVLMQHRQRGADLVFEAYDYDLGGET